MLLQPLAKEMVEAVSGLVEGRTINIMDTEGIIVASTDPDRVGSFHQGALEAVRTGKMVNITREQLSAYPGAKEGCNMPLRVSGTIIGVVGIRGDPPEILAMAHLLEVYAAKYFQLEAMTSPRLAESELRGRVLRALLSPTDKALSDAKALMDTLKIHLEFPVQVLIFSERTGAAQSERQEKLLSALTAKQWLRADRDIWGTVDDRLVLVFSCKGHPAEAHRHELLRSKAAQAEYKLCFGAPCRNLWDISTSYEQATVLELIAHESVNDIQDPATRCDYMLYSSAVREADFIEKLYARLADTFRDGEWQQLLKTAECYYRRERSVTQAAAELFIHKNTLQYRVRRLIDAAGLERCSPFQQEYLVRLLLEHHKRKQGLRALE